ncbi:MAG: iron complex outermembrane receptor protein, partial [Gammaproteobacteria bacterium]
GYDVDATLNIPLIKDSLALRLVGFSAKDAGYIDNVLGSPYLQSNVDNANRVEKNHNSADWAGGRASLKWWVNEDWTATGTFNYQKLNTNGFNDFDPTVGDLEQVNFFEEEWDDEFFQGSMIIEGDLGFAQILSATSYFERDTSYTRDSTAYASYLNFYSAYNDFSANAYYANYNFYDFSPAGGGFDPDARSFWFQVQKDKRITQEIRLSNEGERLDWTLGFFYQEAKQDWDFQIVHPGWENSDAFRGRDFFNGGTLPSTNVRWNSGEKSTRKDISIFGESTFKLNDKISLLFGGRWFDVSIDRAYFVRQPATAPGLPSTPSGSDSGFLPKGGAQYHFDDDKMLYAVYSEGFRSGGVNRGRGNPTLPNQYAGDKLINIEAGIKTQWQEGRLQVNVAGYHQVWKDFQLELTDPSFLFGELFQTVVANVGDAVVDGIEFDITAVPAAGLELGVNGTWLVRAETDQDLVVFDPRDPTTPSLDIPAGQRLPLVADFNASAYGQYTWPMAYFGGEAYIRFQYSYTGASLNKLVADPEPFPQIRQPAYHLGDIKFGFQKESWEAQLYINNVWDERPVTFHDTDNLDRFFGHENIRTSRPRNFGLRIRKYFN